MPKIQTTVVGNLTRDPEVREVAGGATLTVITVAENVRRRDNGEGEWRDVRTTFWGVTCWRKLGVYAACSLRKGDRVVVVGEAYLDEWTGADGQVRRSLKLDPLTVAVDLSRTPVEVARRPQTGATGSGAENGAPRVEWRSAEVVDPNFPSADPEPDEDPYDGRGPDDDGRGDGAPRFEDSRFGGEPQGDGFPPSAGSEDRLVAVPGSGS